MAGPYWEPDAGVTGGEDLPLAERLWSEPYRFSFFAAVRLLSRLAFQRRAEGDEVSSEPADIRYRSLTSLAFPASELWDVKRPELPDDPVEMTVAFFGLTGANGALPRPYAELVIERVRKGDHALRDFLDIINHHLLRQFARAGEKYRFFLNYERALLWEKQRQAQGPRKVRGYLLEEQGRLDLFSQVLLDLGGLGMPLLRHKDSVRDAPAPRVDLPDELYRHFAGHFAKQHKNAVNLAQMVAAYFGVPAEIVQFVGQWVLLPAEFQTCLPAPGSESKTCRLPRLGETTVVGSRLFEVQGKFRVRLGPLTFDQFRQYLPDQPAFRRMSQLVRLFVGQTLDFDIQPTLSGNEVPWCQLGGGGPRAPRLGWNTWLRNQELSGTVDDAVFNVPDEVSLGI